MFQYTLYYKGDKYSRNNSMFLPMNRTCMHVFLPLVVVSVAVVGGVVAFFKWKM